MNGEHWENGEQWRLESESFFGFVVNKTTAEYITVTLPKQVKKEALKNLPSCERKEYEQSTGFTIPRADIVNILITNSKGKDATKEIREKYGICQRDIGQKLKWIYKIYCIEGNKRGKTLLFKDKVIEILEQRKLAATLIAKRTRFVSELNKSIKLYTELYPDSQITSLNTKLTCFDQDCYIAYRHIIDDINEHQRNFIIKAISSNSFKLDEINIDYLIKNLKKWYRANYHCSINSNTIKDVNSQSYFYD